MAFQNWLIQGALALKEIFTRLYHRSRGTCRVYYNVKTRVQNGEKVVEQTRDLEEMSKRKEQKINGLKLITAIEIFWLRPWLTHRFLTVLFRRSYVVIHLVTCLMEKPKLWTTHRHISSFHAGRLPRRFSRMSATTHTAPRQSSPSLFVPLAVL